MGLKDVIKGGTVSARDLRRLAGAMDAARQAASYSASASTVVTPGGVGTAESGDDWFPARVASVVTSSTYTFVEQWVDTSGAVADKPSGRTNSSSDVAVVFGSATYSVADKILVKRSRGAGGFRWEIAPAPAASSGGYATIQEEGTNLTARTKLNFVGAGVTAADDAGNTRTNVTLHQGSKSQEGTVTTSAQEKSGKWTVVTSSAAGATNRPSVVSSTVGTSGNLATDSATLGIWTDEGNAYGVSIDSTGQVTFNDGTNGLATTQIAWDGSISQYLWDMTNAGGTGIGILSPYGSFSTLTGLNAQIWYTIRFSPGIAAASAANNTLFRDTADDKLKYKDNTGTVNALY